MSAAAHSPHLPEAATLLAVALTARPKTDHDLFLREMLAHSAAAVGMLHGSRLAAEAVYALGDELVARGGK